MKTEKNAHLYDYCQALQSMIDESWKKERHWSAVFSGSTDPAVKRDAELNILSACVRRQAIVKAKDIFISMHRGEF